MKLRYVFVFALGMACMYWLVRSGILSITPLMGQGETPQIDSLTTGHRPTTVTGDSVTGTTTSTGIAIVASGSSLSSGYNTSESIVDQTVALINTTGSMNSSASESQKTISPSIYSKTQACAQAPGSYDIPVQVSWNATLTASTKGFVKLGNYIHYIVYVANGTKYYFYYNCLTGVSTNAKNLTSTNVTRVTVANGTVYLK